MPAPDTLPASLPAAALRPATLDELDELLRLEAACFDTDRLSRRSFRRAITRTNTICLVSAAGPHLQGYALVSLRANSPLARLYSIAVDPACRGQHLGETLLNAAETAARDAGCIAMRLEIRRDNSTGLQLYRRMGYRQFGVHAYYYEDHMDALRMEKPLAPRGIAPR